MRLRTRLLTLSLLTLLLPWSGWKLVQELEHFLREGQESNLMATARTVAQALPAEFHPELVYDRPRALPLRTPARAPLLDGYVDEWPAREDALRFVSSDGALTLDVLAAQHGGRLYLFCRVSSVAPPVRPDGAAQGAVLLYLRSARGLQRYRISSPAPGPFRIDAQGPEGSPVDGYWIERGDGYQAELSLPLPPGRVDLSLGAVQAGDAAVGIAPAQAGTLAGEAPETWLVPLPPLALLEDWLDVVVPPQSRAWVVDRGGWVVADSGPVEYAPGQRLTWAQRVLYRVVAGERPTMRVERPDYLLRLDDAVVGEALAGEEAMQWGQDPVNAEVRNTVAMPVRIEGAVRGAVVLEATTDGLLLVTNRALGRVLFTTLLLMLGLAVGLWWFATRLSRRVQRLSGAVSEAMDDGARPGDIPGVRDRDELGELARNNQRLLRQVAEYTRYLETLAGKLSHELKTPLAITRSSLENLESRPLDEEARRYLARALEGLDRQGAMVRAMSEASRLEAAIGSADWAQVDLADVVRQAVEGYQALHPDRAIASRLPERPCPLECAPDLLVQALDKLVDNAIGLTGADDAVTVALERGEKGCRLSVRNTGTALPESLRDQLFDSLVSMRDKQAGTAHLGLGLYIVRLVAEAHGGTASARNVADVGDGRSGVAFTIELPSA